MFVISLILINWFSLSRSTIFWSIYDSNYLFLPDPGLLLKLQFSLSFLFRKYRFDFGTESINISWSILYIEYPLLVKVLSNCCLVVSWSYVFCFNFSLLLIISSSDSTNQNSSSFSYFEDNLDSEVKELFPLSYIFLQVLPSVCYLENHQLQVFCLLLFIGCRFVCLFIIYFLFLYSFLYTDLGY